MSAVRHRRLRQLERRAGESHFSSGRVWNGPHHVARQDLGIGKDLIESVHGTAGNPGSGNLTQPESNVLGREDLLQDGDQHLPMLDPCGICRETSIISKLLTPTMRQSFCHCPSLPTARQKKPSRARNDWYGTIVGWPLPKRPGRWPDTR